MRSPSPWRGRVFTAWGPAGLAASWVAGWIYDRSGDYVYALLLASSAGKSDAPSSKPLRRHAILKNLYASLGVPPLIWRHDSRATRPATGSQFAVPTQSPTTPFHRHYSACHCADRPFPPGISSGTPAQVPAKLNVCAPRVAFRLDLWNRESRERLLSPMPPAHWLSSLGLCEAARRESESLKNLRFATQALLENDAVPRTIGVHCSSPDDRPRTAPTFAHACGRLNRAGY